MRTQYDPTLFGSAERPLRVSSLPLLLACPMRAVLLESGLVEDESGAAAQTGSALHAMVHHYHTVSQDMAVAITTVHRRDGATFPDADWGKAATWAASYAADPRNHVGAAYRSELSVSAVFDPAPHDPTRKPVHIRGTLDQIRLDQHGRYYVLDLKTGASAGMAMHDSYAAQLAAYTLAMQARLDLDDDEIAPPSIMRVRGYETKGVDPKLEPPGVFFPTQFTLDVCRLLIDEVVSTVADIRSGNVRVIPGYQCSTICPARGLSNCLQKFKLL